MDLSKVKEIYERDGYALIPSVFSKEDCDLIRKEAYNVLDHPNAESHLQRVNGRPGLLFWPKDLNLVLSGICYDNRLKEIAKYFLGPKIRHLNNQIYYREAGDGDEFAFHQDIIFRTPKHEFSGIEAKYLQTIIIVDDVDKENGAVEFLPGSHKDGIWEDLVRSDGADLRKFNRRVGGVFCRGKHLEAKSGDVAIWSVMVVHGSEKNSSNRNRLQFMNGFAAEDAVLNKKAFPVYI